MDGWRIILPDVEDDGPVAGVDEIAGDGGGDPATETAPATAPAGVDAADGGDTRLRRGDMGAGDGNQLCALEDAVKEAALQHRGADEGRGFAALQTILVEMPHRPEVAGAKPDGRAVLLARKRA